MSRSLSKVRDARPELEGTRKVEGRNLRRKRRIKVAELHRRHPALMDGAPMAGTGRKATKVSATKTDVPRAAPKVAKKVKKKRVVSEE